MELTNLIQLLSLIVTLLALIWQQHRSFKEAHAKEKRIETKLKIFYELSKTDNSFDEDEIIKLIERNQPTIREVDKVEIRKSLYEMLCEERLGFTPERKYRVRKRLQKGTSKDS